MSDMRTVEGIIVAAESLSGSLVEVASDATGAPEPAWGDVFISYDPDGDIPPERRFPFATVVRSDSDGAVSIADRPGVFRFNVGVGRAGFEMLLGFSPSQAEHAAKFDHTQLDQLLPHPWYSAQGWVSILNPADDTADLAEQLLTEAHEREANRHAKVRGS